MADAARARCRARRCIARAWRRRLPGRVSQSAGGALSAGVGRRRSAGCNHRTAGPARSIAIAASSVAGVRRGVGCNRPCHRRLPGRAGAVDAAGILLAGVAVAAILAALRSFLMLALSDDTVSLQVVLSWVLGGVQTPTWAVLGLFAMISIGCFGLTMLLAGGLDVLGLGETMAVGFGLEVKRFVAWAVLAGSIVVAAAVAFGGLVAFVGLAAPHVARWFVGPMHRPLLPASALVGASIVTIADAI